MVEFVKRVALSYQEGKQEVRRLRYITDECKSKETHEIR